MSTRGRRRVAPVLALCLASCGGEAANHDAEPTPEVEDVGSTSQALGNISTRWSDPNQTPIGASPTHVVFVKRTSSCAENVVSVELETGDSVTMPSWPGECRNPTAAAVDGDVFIYDASSSAILRYTTGLLPGWVKVTDTTGPARGLALNSVYVIWADGAGMFRTWRNGGGVREDLNPATGARIIAQEGATLYYTVPSHLGTELRSMQTNGSSDRYLATSANPITQLGFDATYLYWPDNESSPRRLQKLHKVQRIVSTVTFSADRYYYVPQSTGSALYFVFLQDSQFFMSRRNLVNNNTVNAQFPQPFAPYYLRIGEDEVYTAGIRYGFDVPYGIVHRGDL